MTAADLIREELQRRRQTMSLARFMELALYSPACGYYEVHPRTIGRNGDFFTSVSVGPVFGQVLAAFWAGYRAQAGLEPWTLIEAGAHDGRLALDILDAYRTDHPDLYSRLSYILAEPSATRRELQRQMLQQHSDRVSWIKDLEDLPDHSIRGVVFSNELLDAFPAHRIRWNAQSRSWQEWGIKWAPAHESFEWSPMNVSILDIQMEWIEEGFEWNEELSRIIPDGFTVDIAPAARNWWEKASRKLQHGLLQTIDYGLESWEMLAPERGQGSLRAYHKHQVSAHVLDQPGEQDLTTHVNWTALKRAGEKQGLHTMHFLRQGEFLVHAVAQGGFEGRWNPAQRRQFQTLVHPQHLGHVFKVLVQERKPGDAPPCTGPTPSS